MFSSPYQDLLVNAGVSTPSTPIQLNEDYSHFLKTPYTMDYNYDFLSPFTDVLNEYNSQLYTKPPLSVSTTDLIFHDYQNEVNNCPSTPTLTNHSSFNTPGLNRNFLNNSISPSSSPLMTVSTPLHHSSSLIAPSTPTTTTQSSPTLSQKTLTYSPSELSIPIKKESEFEYERSQSPSLAPIYNKSLTPIKQKQHQLALSPTPKFDKEPQLSEKVTEEDFKKNPACVLDDFPNGERPSITYAKLLKAAILRSPKQRLLLDQIYDIFIKKYPRYRLQSNSRGWQNSVRHNLSLYACFYQMPRGVNDKGRGKYWLVDESAECVAKNTIVNNNTNRQQLTLSTSIDDDVKSLNKGEKKRTNPIQLTHRKSNKKLKFEEFESENIEDDDDDDDDDDELPIASKSYDNRKSSNRLKNKNKNNDHILIKTEENDDVVESEDEYFP